MNSGAGVVLQAGNDTADLGRGTRKVGDQEEEGERCTRVQTATVQVRPKSALLSVRASLRKTSVCKCVCV